jgi:uncharacterized protein (DUF1697 family)
MAKRERPKAASSHVALLRGINVGGKNKLPMKELAAIFTDAGASDVLTYIQSGNVVFRASAALARRLPAVVATAISKRFGFEVPVLMRTAGELRKVASENPFLRAGADVGMLHVAFLTSKPGTAQVDSLDADRSSPDEFELRGREIYLYCPNGIARTKLTNAYFDSKLATTSTVRNWKTVLKLVELSGG